MIDTKGITVKVGSFFEVNYIIGINRNPVSEVYGFTPADCFLTQRKD